MKEKKDFPEILQGIHNKIIPQAADLGSTPQPKPPPRDLENVGHPTFSF